MLTISVSYSTVNVSLYLFETSISVWYIQLRSFLKKYLIEIAAIKYLILKGP